MHDDYGTPDNPRPMSWGEWFRHGDKMDADDITCLLADAEARPNGGIEWAAEEDRARDAGVTLPDDIAEGVETLRAMLAEAEESH